ncbi:MAG: GGDEF domain-containing protein [Gammaproteobacteria bacterium]|nr:GGDEF domain-containing protein [Gammaproteobacteria bacterium]MBT8110218.1 GGDEF domain-containing protein [Gammaproteobacteria bacterium]NND48568.1 GGDEF domain-containing protein [Woeseiaceae bacterium]NNL44921.1 GGDEF domain-containing protein [Woeseiaceae bacterium]
MATNSDYRRSLLEGLELFKGVYPDDVHELLQRCDRRDLAAGELLLSPGAKNEHVFIVLSGSLNIHVGSPEAPVLATMESGACVGEMSIIEDRDPSAYVIGAEDTHMLVMHQSLLWEMVNASHEFAKNLLVVLSERVRSHNRVIADSYGEIRKFERHATTDALTGLANRHSMQVSFPEEIEACVENEESVALIMIDVDRFKQFNDTFGHIAGDRALRAVSEILQKQFRPRDLLVRYGGDEFAVLLPGANIEQAVAVGQRVRDTVCSTTGDGSDSLIKIPIAISMGVAELHEKGTLDGLIRDADAALYRAKHAGRNAVSE